MPHHHIRISDRQLSEFCRERHIRKLAFFGLVVRDDFQRKKCV
jgi:hypothetical protein